MCIEGRNDVVADERFPQGPRFPALEHKQGPEGAWETMYTMILFVESVAMFLPCISDPWSNHIVHYSFPALGHKQGPEGAWETLWHCTCNSILCVLALYLQGALYRESAKPNFEFKFPVALLFEVSVVYSVTC